MARALLILALHLTAAERLLRGGGAEPAKAAAQPLEEDAEDDAAERRRLASNSPYNNFTPKPNCEDLMLTAGITQTKTFTVTTKGTTPWGWAEMQPLMNRLTVNKEYTLRLRTKSNCPDDVVVGFWGGGGWGKTVVEAGSFRFWEITTDKALSVTDGRFGVRSSQTPSVVNSVVTKEGEDEDESETTTKTTVTWPACTITIEYFSLYDAACVNAPAPTPRPSSAPTAAPSPKPTGSPTTSTTTTFPQPTPQTYFQWLFGAVLTPFLPSIKAEETPIQIRWTSLIDAIDWNCVAVYSPSYLDALTKARPTMVAPSYLHDTDTRARCMIAAVDHFSRIFLTDARAGIRSAAGAFRVSLRDDVPSLLAPCTGLDFAKQAAGDPNAFFQEARDNACVTTVATNAAWDYKVVGPIIAEKVMGYGAVDGWNALGNTGRDGAPCTANCRKFRDTTGYEPKDNLINWQPLLEDKGDGFFYRQEHVTPQIGRTATFRALPESERAARVAPDPAYDYTAENALVVNRLAALTDAQKMQVEYMNDKIEVLITAFVTLMEGGKFLSLEHGLAFLQGYTISEYDALIIVWKEKVAWDLIRPTTKIQETDPDVDISCYGGPDVRETATIKNKDFQPYIRVMPHSEYPSGSSCLCRGVQDFMNGFLAAITDPDDVSLPMTKVFAAGSSVKEPGYTPASELTLTYANAAELAAGCSQSRLDGGMHFTAAVPAGETLCDGIGTVGFAYANDLIQGQWLNPNP